MKIGIKAHCCRLRISERVMGGGRAAGCAKLRLNKGAWTPEEDLKLIAHINNHGHHNWRALPTLAGLLRCGKSCRLRWINYLRPDLKRGSFTPEEEETIFRLHRLLGNKWSKIAARLPGRTDNEIKNVWNTHLKKRLRSSSEEAEARAEESRGSSSASSALSQPGQLGATTEGGSSRWVVEYLEKELGLSDQIQNNQVSDVAEPTVVMQQDPVSTYFVSCDLGTLRFFEDTGGKNF